MSELPDWEERCALALEEIERTDLDDNTKIIRVKLILTGELDSAEDDGVVAYHEWREVGVDELPGTDETSPGQSVRYICRKCDAKGYRIVFPTSVTLYPIVCDSPNCRR
jgi:hypothetical protein